MSFYEEKQSEKRTTSPNFAPDFNADFGCKVRIIERSTELEGMPLDVDFPLYVLSNPESATPFDILLELPDGLRRFNFEEFEKEEISEDMSIRFVIKDEQFFTIKFHHAFDLHHVTRIINMKVRAKIPDVVVPEGMFSHSIKPSGEIIMKVRNEINKNYGKKSKADVKKKDVQHSKKPKLRLFNINSVGKSSLSVSQASMDEDHCYGLTNTEYEKWKLDVVMKWFEHIPIMDKHKIISLHTYLERRKLLEPLKDYFGERKDCAPMVEIRTALSSPSSPLRRMKKSKKEGEDEGEEEEDPKAALRDMIKDQNVNERLKMEFRLLKFMGNWYNPSFNAVMKKRLKSRKQVETRRKFVTQFENMVLFKFQTSWSVRALMLKLAFNLLYGKSIEEFADEMEYKYENVYHPKQKSNNIAETMDRFNKEVLKVFKLEDICMRMRVTKKFQLLSQEKKSLNEAMDVCESRLSDNCKILKDEVLAEMKNVAENMKDMISKLDPTNEEDKKTIKDLEKKIRRTKNEKRIAKMFKKSVQDERKKRKRLERMFGIRVEKMEFIENAFQQECHNSLWEFKHPTNGCYWKAVEALVEEKLRQIFDGEEDDEDEEDEGEEDEEEGEDKKKKKKKNSISIKTKVVISSHQQAKIGLKKKLFLGAYKKLSVYNELDYVKLGFTHAGIIFQNVGVQWFNSEVVVCEDLRGLTKFMEKFEDIACFDTQTLRFLSREEFRDFLKTVATFIVSTNTNNTYDAFGVRTLQKPFVLNCQELAANLMNQLDIPFIFYREVQEYIDSLGEKSKMKKFEDDTGKKFRCFRRVKIPKEFQEDEDVKKMCEESGSSKSAKSIFFPTHKSLDQFTKLLMSKYSKKGDFKLDFPGLYHLLKAFDRSFWVMKYHRTNPDDRNEPLLDKDDKCDCPFSKTHQDERYDLQDGEVEEEEEEEEEEKEEEEEEGLKLMKN